MVYKCFSNKNNDLVTADSITFSFPLLVLFKDSSNLSQDGIEECRKLCGGHGYLCTSGLPELFAVYVPACTYEGDNIVLLLQVVPDLYARLVKLFNDIYMY